MIQTLQWLGSNWVGWGVEHRYLKRRTSWRGVHIVHKGSEMRSIGFCERQTSGRKYQKKNWFIFVKIQLQLSDVFFFPQQSSHFYPGSEGNQTLFVGKLISMGILDEGSQAKHKPSSFKTWGFVESWISENENEP